VSGVKYSSVVQINAKNTSSIIRLSPFLYLFFHPHFFKIINNIVAKAARKMLMKLTPVINFINILEAAF